jgi:molybdopterin converting factor subunit 1
MKVLYFAWLRSHVGVGEEEVDPPPEVVTVGQLIDWLTLRSPSHAAAFARKEVVRAAVNLEFAGFDHAVAANDEVAFFPPVTGG